MTALDLGVRPITIAILAMGGEGGGVLSDWIVDLAEHGGYLAQATSVPGVAQRTGATIYYVELFPKAAAEKAGRDPVLALMPMPGDVDVVVASELMEAGRAVQRGFVTPDRTTFIASTHRVYSMTERIAPSDGRVDESALLEGCRAAAKRLIAFDMAALAEATGSVISAVLFGVLAGSGALPFARPAFEAAIRRGRVGVKASLAAFTAGFEAAESGSAIVRQPPKATGALPPPTLDGRDAAAGAADLEAFPQSAREVIHLGIERTTDYQDAAYARLYLDRLRPFATEPGSERLLAEVARQLALGMAYEDTVRVAELKIRPARFARVRDEVRLSEEQLLEIAEFMHPRIEEIADTLPKRWGEWLLKTAWARRAVGRFAKRGRIVRTSTIRGFLQLYAVAALKPWRPGSLRFAREQAHLESWLDEVRRAASRDEALALEIALCRGLVRGYGDTHAGGRERFDAIMSVLPAIVREPGAAGIVEDLRRAALDDETGDRLAHALRGIGLRDGDSTARASEQAG
ncbi:MAG TPA: indolepyruvate oxidoreductase subunit beta family protein [Beijerinckiaceae bacterium]|jgi:indolepyruvate ferredoxin oxidoreductase beta subunit